MSNIKRVQEPEAGAESWIFGYNIDRSLGIEDSKSLVSRGIFYFKGNVSGIKYRKPLPTTTCI